MESSDALTKEQITAISRAKKIGQTLAESSPEIADDYRNGTFQRDIARKVIPNEYGRCQKVAVNAIGYALKILLSEEELRRLSDSNHRRNSIAVGEYTIQEKKGIHAQTLEERVKAAKKGYERGLGKIRREFLSDFGKRGGKKAAKTNELQRTGIYGLTEEQRRELGHKGGLRNYQEGLGIYAMTTEEKAQALIKSIQAQGKVPFLEKEKKLLVELANDPAYQYPKGKKQQGRPNYEIIRLELFNILGIERSVPSLRTMYYRINKKNCSL